MNKSQEVRESAANLRRRAEARVAESSDAALHSPAEEGPATAQLHRELHVHQIELQLQNEELQRTGAALEKALVRYTNLYERAPIGYLTLAHDGEIQQINIAGARILGKMAAQLVGKRLGAFIAPGSLSTLNAFLLNVWGHLSESGCELTTRTDGPAGRILALTGTASGYIACVIVDITDRRRAETALVQSEEAYRHLFQSNPIPMCIIDRETTVFLAVNDALLALYGYAREELLEMRFAELRSVRGRASPDPQDLTGKSVHRTRTGADITVELSAHDIVFGGRPGRVVAITDLTAQHALEG